MPLFMLPVWRSVPDDVRHEALLHRGHRLTEEKASASVPHVEDHAALARLEHERPHAALLVDDRDAPVHVRVGVREDVAWAQMLHEQIFERQRRRVAAEIDHDRHVGRAARLDAAEHGIPFGPAVVRDLDPDDDAGVLSDAHGRQPRVHVREVLLDRAALHARADDVDEREDARPGAIDHLILELREVAPARAAHVDERRLAAAERVVVGCHGAVAVAQVRVTLGAVEDVRVHVDEAGHDVESRRVDDAPRERRVDFRRDPGDLGAGDRDVRDRIDAVLRVDHVAVPDQEIELGVLRIQERNGNGDQATHDATPNVQ